MHRKCTQAVYPEDWTKPNILQPLENAGFINVRVVKERQINLPYELLLQHITKEYLKLSNIEGLSQKDLAKQLQTS